jgi:hypothetical protein
MKRFQLITMAVLVSASLSVNALAQQQTSVWRWVDENGVTHYTQYEPEGVEAERVSINEMMRQRRNPSPPADNDQQASASQEQDAAQPDDIAARQQAYREEIAAFCRDARKALGDLTGTPRVLVTPPGGGDPYIMTEEERQAEIARLESEIAENCEGDS